jgi:LPXTG-site transpeptidase (sortase) family protein
MKKVYLALGALLVVVASVAIVYPFYWKGHLAQAKKSLLDRPKIDQVINPPLMTSGSYAPSPKSQLALPAGASCSSSPTPEIIIPSLGLDAPVEEGVTPAVLDVSVGHVTSSPWPLSQSGFAIFAAHDVSYFAQIDRLKQGDVIIYKDRCQVATYQVSNYLISNPGKAIPIPSGSGVVLDTCYPTTALFYTNQRYLVVAKYKSLSEVTSNGTYSYHVVAPINLTTSIPVSIPANVLSLSNNSQVMGEMNFAGSPDISFEQSVNPMNAEEAALSNYFALLYSLKSSSTTLWAALTSSPYPSLLASPTTRSTSALDVTETVNNDQLVSISLTTSINGHPVSIIQVDENGLLKISSVQTS